MTLASAASHHGPFLLAAASLTCLMAGFLTPAHVSASCHSMLPWLPPAFVLQQQQQQQQQRQRPWRRTQPQLHVTAPASADSIVVLPDAAAVGEKVRSIVQEAAEEALKERGHFAVAIPGGSILKMLVGPTSFDTSQTTLAYVNHKCVAMENGDLATHAKASKLFLTENWKGCNVIVMDGTNDGPAEAASYQAKLKALSSATELPLDDKTSFPRFDLMLIGVGDDGHVGSLYPHREEVLDTSGAWVLNVDMKNPPSITLSLGVMKAAKRVVVAACGVSEKYPKGKADAMRRAISETAETPASFPASALREVATWILDEAAAAELGL